MSNTRCAMTLMMVPALVRDGIASFKIECRVQPRPLNSLLPASNRQATTRTLLLPPHCASYLSPPHDHFGYFAIPVRKSARQRPQTSKTLDSSSQSERPPRSELTLSRETPTVYHAVFLATVGVEEANLRSSSFPQIVARHGKSGVTCAPWHRHFHNTHPLPGSVCDVSHDIE